MINSHIRQRGGKLEINCHIEGNTKDLCAEAANAIIQIALEARLDNVQMRILANSIAYLAQKEYARTIRKVTYKGQTWQQ